MLIKLDPQPEAFDWEEADGIGLRWAKFAAGTVVPQHAHSYDHVSLIPLGEVILEEEGMDVSVKLVGPTAIVIKAHRKHIFRFVTDGMLVCIHNTERTGSIEVESEHQLGEP